MYNVWTITKKEFRSYFGSLLAYIFIFVFLVVANWLFFMNFFLSGQATMRDMFANVQYMFIVLAPAFAMRLWAEERKLGTIEILFTLPVRDWEAVLGKYIAGLAFLTLNLLLTVTVPVTLYIFGAPDAGPIVGGYVGLFLLGAAYLAVGAFASSVTDNQIIAFVLGVTACFLLFIIGMPAIVVRAPGFIAPVLQYLGTVNHFQSIARGVIDSSDIVYYLSVVVFFISLTAAAVEQRK